MVPFSIIFVGEFCVTIYNLSHNKPAFIVIKRCKTAVCVPPFDTPPISSIPALESCMLFRSRDYGHPGQIPGICRHLCTLVRRYGRPA